MSILQHKKPNNVIITVPNHITRQVQLYYDDVRTNASPFGIVQMMINCNYSVNQHLALITFHEYDFTVSCNYQGPHFPKEENLLQRTHLDLLKSKAEIFEIYRKQYQLESTGDIFPVFGTSIDSSLLASFHDGPVIYVKDNALDGELFRGQPVEDVSYYDGPITVPILMNNADAIKRRLDLS